MIYPTTLKIYTKSYHFEKNKKGEIDQIISSSFNNKEAKNSASYRESILIVTNFLMKHYPKHHVTKTLVRNARNIILTRQ